MNIITGINRTKEKGKTLGSRIRMSVAVPYLVVLSLTFVACSSKQQVKEVEVSPKSDVRVSSPVIGNAEKLMKFQAVTRYMQSNDIRTQIAGIVTQIFCSVAGEIHTNQPLFIIEPQEAAALKRLKFNSQMLTGLSDTIFANLSGQISKLNVQVGDFVQIGDALASCIRGNSMRIIAFVPVEQISEVEKLKHCRVIFPDGSAIDGSISSKLTSADPNDQTQSYIIDTKKAVSLSENINLNVQFTGAKVQDAVFVPVSAVIGNEEQTNFWVMKMVNDTICIKVQVEKGMKQDSLVQLIGSNLTISDRVISEGAYGLADSSRVQILNSENEKLNKPDANSKSTSSRH